MRSRECRSSFSSLPHPRPPIPDPGPPTPDPESSGFSLLEVLVATALVTGAIVSVAQLLTVASRANATARDVTLSSVLAEQKLEQLRSLAWGFDSTGISLSDVTTDLSVDPPSPVGGTGLGASPPNTLSENVAGYVDYVDAAGGWVGTGAEAPLGATYVRRWSIAPAMGQSDTLILEVVVLHVRRQKTGGAVSSAHLVNDAHVVSVKTRKWL